VRTRTTAMHVVIQQDPYNAETPLEVLAEEITPTESFFVRCHFGIPLLDLRTWHLEVEGAVRHPLRLSLSDLQALAHRAVVVTLECAGNGRALVDPVPSGVPWKLGAVGTACFVGVPLHHVLQQVGLLPGAVEVLFVGADAGEVEPGRREAFARSLPVDVALGSDVLLAWAMNGRPLRPEHGFPLRLVVPGWYGMASVKWLSRIVVLTEPFRGFFQTERYVYANGAVEPVTRIRVRSLIVHPQDGARLPEEPADVLGIAWSGYGPIREVLFSADGRESFDEADLLAAPGPHAAVRWHVRWVPPRAGTYTLTARAADVAGHTQPRSPYRLCHTIRVTVGEPS